MFTMLILSFVRNELIFNSSVRMKELLLTRGNRRFSAQHATREGPLDSLFSLSLSFDDNFDDNFDTLSRSGVKLGEKRGMRGDM